MIIDSEILAATYSMCIWRSSIARWESPHDGEPITDHDRDEIISDIRRIVLAAGSEDILVCS